MFFFPIRALHRVIAFIHQNDVQIDFCQTTSDFFYWAVLKPSDESALESNDGSWVRKKLNKSWWIRYSKHPCIRTSVVFFLQQTQVIKSTCVMKTTKIFHVPSTWVVITYIASSNWLKWGFFSFWIFIICSLAGINISQTSLNNLGHPTKILAKQEKSITIGEKY